MSIAVTRQRKRIQAGLLLASLAGLLAPQMALAFPAGEPPSPQTGTGASGPQKKNPLLKLAEPWPSAEEMRRHKEEAETRPLFSSAEPLAFTLTSDFKQINKDRDPKKDARYPAELKYSRPDGGTVTIPVKLGARGHVRRLSQTCDFVPLRVEFPKDSVKDTHFDGQRSLKLVVQCRNGGEYDQYVLREHLAYRIFNLLTPQSVRSRLATVTYVDSTTGRTIGTRYGMFLEHDNDVARRHQGRSVELQRIQFKDLDADTLETMMVFAYMIGNTDFSIYALHNVILVQTPDRMLYPVPYDFDISGLVHPPYAIPMKTLPIKSVNERLYRGPCRTLEQMEPILASFNAKKAAVMDLIGAIAGINRTVRQDVRTFLEDFYSTISSRGSVKRVFVDTCSKAPAM